MVSVGPSKVEKLDRVSARPVQLRFHECVGVSLTSRIGEKPTDLADFTNTLLTDRSRL